MKALKFIAFSILLYFAGAQICLAQKYYPKDTWPYINQDFLDGSVRTSEGVLLQNAKMNVSVVDGKLHFIKDDVIMASDMMHVFTARIGDEVFVNVNGRMMKVLAENKDGAVISETTVDMEQLGKSDIGYGISSATASTQRVTSLLDGGADMVNMNLLTAISKRGAGNDLPVAVKKYLRTGTVVVLAYKKYVNDLQFIDQSAAKSFFKENKIKWNDPESLLSVVSFIAAQNQK